MAGRVFIVKVAVHTDRPQLRAQGNLSGWKSYVSYVFIYCPFAGPEIIRV